MNDSHQNLCLRYRLHVVVRTAIVKPSHQRYHHPANPLQSTSMIYERVYTAEKVRNRPYEKVSHHSHKTPLTQIEIRRNNLKKTKR
jgi:hypothetical protein